MREDIEAMTDEEIAIEAHELAGAVTRTLQAAEPILSFLAFVEADYELAGDKLDDEDAVCELNVAGGSTRLTIGHLRKLREAICGDKMQDANALTDGS